MQESERWLYGEPSLDEMLTDPIVRALMKYDGLNEDAVRGAFLAAAQRLKDRSETVGRAA